MNVLDSVTYAAHFLGQTFNGAITCGSRAIRRLPSPTQVSDVALPILRSEGLRGIVDGAFSMVGCGVLGRGLGQITFAAYSHFFLSETLTERDFIHIVTAIALGAYIAHTSASAPTRSPLSAHEVVAGIPRDVLMQALRTAMYDRNRAIEDGRSVLGVRLAREFGFREMLPAEFYLAVVVYPDFDEIYAAAEALIFPEGFDTLARRRARAVADLIFVDGDEPAAVLAAAKVDEADAGLALTRARILGVGVERAEDCVDHARIDAVVARVLLETLAAGAHPDKARAASEAAAETADLENVIGRRDCNKARNAARLLAASTTTPTILAAVETATANVAASAAVLTASAPTATITPTFQVNL